MAFNTNAKVDFTAKDAGNNAVTFRSDPVAEARTDLAEAVHGTATLTTTNTTTEVLSVDLVNNTPLANIRLMYVETNAAVTVSLLDNDAATKEITSLELGGASGTGAAKAFVEMDGFTIAAGDTFSLSVNTAGANARVTYFLAGDARG